MPDLNAATMTVLDARERIDRLRNAIRAFSAASYQRALVLNQPERIYRDAVNADERARLVTFAELDMVADLMLGLVEERGRSATAMRLLTEDGAA